MNYHYFALVFALLLFSTPPTKSDKRRTRRSAESGGAINSRISANQAKRDLSLSYSATDIDSKEGARVKMITVIKNIGGNEKLRINPELHKNEEWGTLFRDNFSAYGKIPEVPDVDDLFEFVKNKQERKGGSSSSSSSGGSEKPKKPIPVPVKPAKKSPPTELEKPVKEMTENMEPRENEAPVEKIQGDAEFISIGKRSNSSSGLRSQSLYHRRPHRVREALVNLNYSTPQHSVQQYFENYVQENSKGYNYPQPQPCAQQPPNGGSVTVTTPSGRTYDIPVGNSNNNGKVGNPYIAPGVSKKTPQQAAPPNPQTVPGPAAGAGNQGTYSVNSILPPLPTNTQPTATLPANNNQQQRPSQSQNGQPNGFSTSQRPYVAPNVLNSGGGSGSGVVAINRRPAKPIFVMGGPKHFRTNVFGLGSNRPNTARSRGLKY